MRKLFVVALVLTCFTAKTHGETVKLLRLILPPQPSHSVENVGRVFTRQVQDRCAAQVVAQGEVPLAVELTVEPGIGAEGFKIAGTNGTVRIIGNDDRGLLFGVGKFLHTSAYGSEGFTPSSWRGVSVPKMPVRGIYLATHLHNYYQTAPIEEVTRYAEDLSLWGSNSFLVWFGMEEFNGIDDPKAQAMIARLRALLKIVKDLGLDASLGCIANDGYANSPVSLRADRRVGHGGYYPTLKGRLPSFGSELCPSKPGVPELEMKYCEEKFDAFKSIGLDYWFFAPYDNGGCTCSECEPWGANGYLRMAEPLARAYRRAFPKGKVILSTWRFDLSIDGEWDGMTEKFKKQKPDWVDYIMADSHQKEYPRYPLEKGVPGGLPLLCFPEISMWGQRPWGGYGANPQPDRLQGRWNKTKDKLSGGFPYSEGIYEDLNKAICAQLFWQPYLPAMEVVKEYIAYEFSPEVVDDVVSVVKILEKNHLRGQIGKSAVTAYRLMERADAKLEPQIRRSWRWRILYLRALIDQEMYKNTLGQAKNEVFEQARQELVKIYHAETIHRRLRPARILANDLIGPNLSAEYAKAILASKPVAWWRMIPSRDNQADAAAVENSGFLDTDPEIVRRIEDATGHKVMATCEKAVLVGMPPAADVKTCNNQAASFCGGRLKATIKELADNYSVELWFNNTMSHTDRMVTGHLFSRGQEGLAGNPPPGDSLGIGGKSKDVLPGRLFFSSRGRNKVDRVFGGETELIPGTWNHIVMVREGKQVAVYLNGNATPEISAKIEKGYPNGVARIFLGGRNDSFANFQGKMAEISLYDRALAGAEAKGHYKTARPRE